MPAKKKKKRVKRLTAVQLRQFKALLLGKRSEILGTVESIEYEASNASRPDLPTEEFSTGTYEMENALCMADSERRILRKIDEALGRIHNKTYGICLGTGKLIKMTRLKAIPWTKYSVAYASLLEQGLVYENGQDVDAA
jgi:DnaK suppressor protein